MPLSHHPLVSEFPEYKDKIHQLKMENNHFHQLMEKYDELDKQIFRIEDGSEPTDDAYVEQLKKERLALKDDILRSLKAN
ncbi:MAG TPA: DUF465 domain-containing protein [Gammaproteobacteria bacterium]|nr:DUF465 domain-containing protein [Gammaproteobacteria bacterium]